MKLILALTTVVAAYSVNTLAQTERDLDSHVHGSASLNIAISESFVFIELNTPWNNIVGFEHAPRNDEQRLLVETALQQLQDPTQLFAFDAGDCVLDEANVEDAMTDAQHDGDHEDHDDEHKDEHDKDHDDEHKDEHDEDHDDEHKDEHDEDHDDEHKGEHDEDHDDSHANEDGESKTHSAVLAIYSYECKQIDKLNTIDATLFSIWTGFKELDVQLIGDNGQTLVELDPANTVINIAQVR